MKRIFPFIPTPTCKGQTWINYSQYLFWLGNDIESIQYYINYFQPSYKLVNNSLETYNIISHKSYTLEASSSNFYTYEIQEEGASTETVHCYFPSQLLFKQGFHNTTPNSYLCYFSPPQSTDKVIISRSHWNKLKNEGKIHTFPDGFMLFASAWSTKDVQDFFNSSLWNPNMYKLIPSSRSSLYGIEGFPGGLAFKYIDGGTSKGLKQIFYLDTKPSRYYFNTPDLEKWGADVKNKIIRAATYSNINQTEPDSTNIINKNNRVWTGAYPLAHRLELHHGVSRELFIMDERFSTEIVNVVNHQVAQYTINTDLENKDITEKSIFKDVHINIC